MRTSTDLVNSEVLTAVKGLARRSHSAPLAQLASKMIVVMPNQNDVFTKIKGLINDMIAKLEKEAEEDAAEKSLQ